MEDIIKYIEESAKEVDEDNSLVIDIDENIDISKYEPEQPGSSEEMIINIFQAFLCYFKQVFQRESKENMFDYIDPDCEDSTNKCMEIFYDHMMEFKNSPDPNKDIMYEPDSSLVNFKGHVLVINNKPVYVCAYFFPLISYIAGIDWMNLNWTIITVN